jgi:hypothetical protein
MSNITLTAGTSQDTPDAAVLVTVNPPPAPGSQLNFSLVVIDELGNVSPPSVCTVIVESMPVAVLQAQPTISSGQQIPLVGASSTPVGRLKTYRWALAAQALTPLPPA